MAYCKKQQSQAALLAFNKTAKMEKQSKKALSDSLSAGKRKKKFIKAISKDNSCFSNEKKETVKAYKKSKRKIDVSVIISQALSCLNKLLAIALILLGKG